MHHVADSEASAARLAQEPPPMAARGRPRWTGRSLLQQRRGGVAPRHELPVGRHVAQRAVAGTCLAQPAEPRRRGGHPAQKPCTFASCWTYSIDTRQGRTPSRGGVARRAPTSGRGSSGTAAVGTAGPRPAGRHGTCTSRQWPSSSSSATARSAWWGHDRDGARRRQQPAVLVHRSDIGEHEVLAGGARRRRRT